jgi:hypothetical protein
MLVKINEYTKTHVKVTELDIDQFGSIIPLRDLEFKIMEHNNNLLNLIRQSSYAAIFTQKDITSKDKDYNFSDETSDIIVLVNPITLDELNNEKKKVIESNDKVRKNYPS